jgi:hypothetical protein
MSAEPSVGMPKTSSLPGGGDVQGDVVSHHRAQLVDEEYWHRLISEKHLPTWEGDVQGDTVTGVDRT